MRRGGRRCWLRKFGWSPMALGLGGLSLAVLSGCDPGLSRNNPWDPASSTYADGDGDGVPATSDCDDGNPNQYPGAAEVCNGLDDDCADGADDGLTFLTYFLDSDGDDFGVGSGTERCDGPANGETATAGDCDDSDEDVYPDAREICNGVSDDCDAAIDEGLPVESWYPDDDGDHVGDDSGEIEGCEKPSGFVGTGGDCDDSDGSIFPGAAELCDGIDNDCDLDIDEGLTYSSYYIDSDSDGYGAGTAVQSCAPMPGYATTRGDCDDANPDRNPGEQETCDGEDNDCDLLVDDGLPVGTYYTDGDGDGHGHPDTATVTCARTDLVTLGDDCDDTEATTYPTAQELCDGVDNNCNSIADEDLNPVLYYQDDDGDTYGEPERTLLVCDAGPPSGYVANSLDCNDRDANDNPDASERCDELDNDCDEQIDEEFESTVWYLDADSDGYGDDTNAISSCLEYEDRVTAGGDCDDVNPEINPDAGELCDGRDNNCNGVLDEGLVNRLFYRDSDQDGFGDPAASVTACAAPDGTVSGATDCDDEDPLTNPDADERFDLADNDCDGQRDDSIQADFQAELVLASSAPVTGRSLLAPALESVGTALLAGAGADRAGNGAELWLSSGIAQGTGTPEATLMLNESGGAEAQAAGDFDGNGQIDLALSLVSSTGSSSVSLYLQGRISLTGTLQSTDGERVSGSSSGDLFGASLASADVDGDGRDELLVGAPGADGQAGKVAILSLEEQITGEITFVERARITGTEAGDGLGTRLAAVAGWIFVSAPDSMLGSGLVYAIETSALATLEPGATRPVEKLASVTLTAPDGEDPAISSLGQALATSGDFTGDGVPELLVGASTGDSTGRVFLVAIPSREVGEISIDTISQVFQGSSDSRGIFTIGSSMAGVGDLNGDGVPDFALSAIDFVFSRGTEGWLLVFYGGSSSYDSAARSAAGASFFVPLSGSGRSVLCAGGDFFRESRDGLAFATNGYQEEGAPGLILLFKSPLGAF